MDPAALPQAQAVDSELIEMKDKEPTTTLEDPGREEEADVEREPIDSDLAPDGKTQHTSVIMPLASMAGENDHSTRSESVNSNSGSCDGDTIATTSCSSGQAQRRRRSSRLQPERIPTRKSTRIVDHENTEGEHTEDRKGSEGKEMIKAGPRGGVRKVSAEKPDYTLRTIAPERQLNPHINLMWDGFCWRCHKPVPLPDQHGCPSCVRIFHGECWWNDSPYGSKDIVDNRPVHAAFGHNLDRETDGRDECIECFCILEEEKKEDNIYKRVGIEKFQKYLQYMMLFVDDHLPPERVRPFAIPVMEQDECSESVKDKYKEYITCPMDLRQIGQNIIDAKYETCASFLADLRWIYHNTSIFNGQNNRYTRSAFYIVETCQHLCYSLEWCMECFERGMPVNGESIHEAAERGMINPCSDPHAVVWVKAEKFPIWPAVVYRFNGSFADVRFFGAFEFGAFPTDAIFLFSKTAVTDRRKGRLKLDYENALRQFRLHVNKLRQIPGKELISYPKRTVYDGRLWMFPEGEEANQPLQVEEGAIDPVNQEEMDIDDTEAGSSANDPEDVSKSTAEKSKDIAKLIQRSQKSRQAASADSKRSRSGSPSEVESTKKRRREHSHEDIANKNTELIEKLDAHEPADITEGEALLDFGIKIGQVDPVADVPSDVHPILNVCEDINKAPTVEEDIEEAQVNHGADDSAGSLPSTPTECVKPVFFESDSDNDGGEIFSSAFEVQEDSDESPATKPSGKLDNILKRPTPTPPDQTRTPEPDPAILLASVGLGSRNPALTHELNKSLNNPYVAARDGKTSVLHDALVRPLSGQLHNSDAITNILRRNNKAPSMASASPGQAHLIEALRASPRSEDRQRKPDHTDSGSDARRSRDDTLGSLLAGGQRRDFGRSMAPNSSRHSDSNSLSGNRQILPKQENTDVRVGIQDGRKSINAVSSQLIAARNAQARLNHTEGNSNSSESNLQRSILARSLNAPSINLGRSNGTTGQNLLNGSVDLNGGDRRSPSMLQTAMRNLVSQRATHSPSQETIRNIPSASQLRRPGPAESGSHSQQTESVQTQIDIFLRNTKKIIKDKRDEAGQTTRESAQAHADNLRMLHDAQLKNQQRTEKTLQELQETMEQSIRKFELLFMVFHNECEFSQKSRILEVSRMKDLERQRAVTAAKRTLWCCVCQKRARMICCGVTMYCSENCHISNAALHRLHCRRLQQQSEEEDNNGSVYTPYGVLVRCTLLPPGLDDEDDLETGAEDGNLVVAAGAGHNYADNNGWNSAGGRPNSGPVEVIDVSHDEEPAEES